MIKKKRSAKCSNTSIRNRKTNKCTKCPNNYIVRNGYYRQLKPSIPNKSKKIKKIYISEKCIKSRGLPGKTSLKYSNNQGIGKLKKGELGAFGYHHVRDLSEKQRRKSLRLAEKKMGAPGLLRKLGAIKTYLKNTSPETSAIFYEDQRWVRKTFSKQFKQNDTNSSLFN